MSTDNTAHDAQTPKRCWRTEAEHDALPWHYCDQRGCEWRRVEAPSSAHPEQGVDPPGIHHLKTDEQAWDALARGDKTAEFRRDDRGYIVGDVLMLQRGTNNDPSNPTLVRRVTHIVRGPDFGVPDGYAMLSVAPHPESLRSRLSPGGATDDDLRMLLTSPSGTGSDEYNAGWNHAMRLISDTLAAPSPWTPTLAEGDCWPASDEAAEEIMRRLYEHSGGIAWRDERVRLTWIPIRERMREMVGALIALGIVVPAASGGGVPADLREKIAEIQHTASAWHDWAKSHPTCDSNLRAALGAIERRADAVLRALPAPTIEETPHG